MKNIKLFFRNQPPGRLIASGFALVILLGAFLLLLPVSIKDGAEVSVIDALFTSTSAVCVTGLIAMDIADHFTVFGQAVVAILIQVGGLGVTSIGVGLVLAAGKRVGIKSRVLVKEALNVDTYKGIVRLVKAVLMMTLCFEAGGALLSFLVFSQDYAPLHAAGISLFHSIAAFNNSGFDILGGLQNLIPYQDDVLLNLTTCTLIIFGGLGFLVILDVLKQRRFSRLALHSKVVIVTSLALLAVGTVFLKATEDIILHVPDRTVYQCGLIHPVRADVHRRVARLYRRRHQDQYLLRDISGDTGHVHEEDGPRLPPEHLQAECFKSIYDHDSFWHGRRHCGIFDVYSGTGFQFHAALL